MNHRATAASRLAILGCLTPAAALLLLLLAGPDALPLASPPESAASCRPCHGRPGNEPVGEWLASPYSQAEGGRGCTACHGPHCSGSGGAGVADGSPDLEGAARVTVAAVCTGGQVETEVVVTNLGAGHDLPTGPPERTLVLEVSAFGEDGQSLAPRGRATDGFFRRLFVKSVPAGRPGGVRARLAPFETDVSRYVFTAPLGGPARVTARLRLVRASGIPAEVTSTTALCYPPGAPDRVVRPSRVLPSPRSDVP